jgi:hypothetical protein
MSSGSKPNHMLNGAQHAWQHAWRHDWLAITGLMASMKSLAVAIHNHEPPKGFGTQPHLQHAI